MAAAYPSSLKFFPPVQDRKVVETVHVNSIYDEVLSMQTIIGLNPHISSPGTGAFNPNQATYTTVSQRIANLENGFRSSIFDSKYIKRQGETSVVDLTSVTGVSQFSTGAIGDKIALWTNSYGFGIQNSRLVAFVDPGAAFAVRQPGGAGGRSAGAEMHTLFANGNYTAVGTVTSAGFVTTGSAFAGRIQVREGAGNGFRFPNDAFGGGSDTAAIELLNPLGGESTELTVTMTNDGDERFTVRTTGGQFWRSPLAPVGNGLPVALMSQNGTLRLGDGNYANQRLEVIGNAIVTGFHDVYSNLGVGGHTTMGTGFTANGVSTINSGGQGFNLRATSADHVYLAFYARTGNQGQRSGYIGYPSNGSTTLTIANEIGGVSIVPGLTVGGGITVGGPASVGNALNVGTTASFGQRTTHNGGIDTNFLNVTGTNFVETNGVSLKNGKESGDLTGIQIGFGYRQGNNYRNAIKTRHNGGGPNENAIDFYTWAPDVGVPGEPNRRAFIIDGLYARAMFDFYVSGQTILSGLTTAHGGINTNALNAAHTNVSSLRNNGLTFAQSDILFESPTRRTLYPANVNVGMQIRSNGTGTLELNSDNNGAIAIGNGGGRTFFGNGGLDSTGRIKSNRYEVNAGRIYFQAEGDTNHSLGYSARFHDGLDYRGFNGHQWYTTNSGDVVRMTLGGGLLQTHNGTGADFGGNTRVRGALTVDGNISAGVLNVSQLTGNYIQSNGNMGMAGFDFAMGFGDQSSRGNSGNSRALVKGAGATLIVNFGGDFTGGTIVNSSLRVDGPINSPHMATFASGTQVGGSTVANGFYYDSTNIALRAPSGHFFQSTSGGSTHAFINSVGMSVGLGGGNGTGQKFEVGGNIRLTGGVISANGSAGAPGYTFNDDRDSGMYLQSDGALAFAANSTRGMLVQPGRVTAAQDIYFSGLLSMGAAPSSAVFRTYENVVGYNSQSNAQRGAIVFLAPYGFINHMQTHTIKGYTYDSDGAIDLQVSFYNSSGSGFVNNTVLNHGSKDIQVRVARFQGRVAIILGDVGSQWSYPKVVIAHSLMGHSGVNENLMVGWESFTTESLVNYDLLTTPPVRGNGLFSTETIPGTKTHSGSLVVSTPSGIGLTVNRNVGGNMFNVTNNVDQDFIVNLSPAFVDPAQRRTLIAPSTPGRLAFGTQLTERMSINSENRLTVGGGSGSIHAAGAIYTANNETPWNPTTQFGTKGGYAGFHFNDVRVGLLVTNGIQGFHDPSTGWKWYFNNGVLEVGTVPVGRVSDGASLSTTQTFNASKHFGAGLTTTSLSASTLTASSASLTNLAFTGGTNAITFQGNSDRGYIYYQQNSAQVLNGSTGQSSRLIIGVNDDAVNDEVWINGGGRNVFNVGAVDSEVTAAGFGMAASFTGQWAHEFRVNNNPVLRIRNDGLLGVPLVRNTTDNGPYIDFTNGTGAASLRAADGGARITWGVSETLHTGNSTFIGQVHASGASGRILATGGSTSNTSWSTAPIEIRKDRNQGLARIAFHSPGFFAPQIGVDYNGGLRTFNEDGGSYSNFVAGGITSGTGYIASYSPSNPQFFLGNAATGVNIALAQSAGNWHSSSTSGSFVLRTNAGGTRIVFSAGNGSVNSNAVVITETGSIVAGASNSGGYDVVLHSIMNR